VLANLDRTPLSQADLRELSLQTPIPESHGAVCGRVADAENVGAAHSAQRGNKWCWLLGEIENQHEIAALLGSQSAPAEVVLAALQKWGPKVSDLLRGEWSLVWWDGDNGALWLGASRQLRDHTYFAHQAGRVAISGDLLRLGSLSWVGSSHDPCGIAAALGSSNLRQQLRGRTPFKGISTLQPGTMHRFAADGSHAVFGHADDRPIPAQGSFGDAVAAIEQRLQTIVSDLLSRHQRIAILLSGGLDSAIVARFVAQTRKPGQQIVALTAVSPPGVFLPDERALAASVAASFDFEQRLVWPGEDARIFRPDPAHFADGRLNLSPRHYLDKALFDAARDFGATLILDGTAGELSVTASYPPATLANWLRAMKRWLGEVAAQHRAASAMPGEAFLVPPSPILLGMLPPSIDPEPRPRRPRFWPRKAGPMGLADGHEKASRSPTSVPGGGMRQHSPLRDLTLLKMVGGLPAAFVARGGEDRALARALLRGHVPDHVAMQSKGLGFSVDYDLRFKDELFQVPERYAEWRQADVARWLDLDWLEREIARVSGLEDVPVSEKFRVQLSVLAAEYFHYCHENSLG
jgi:hypothetical protein